MMMLGWPYEVLKPMQEHTHVHKSYSQNFLREVSITGAAPCSDAQCGV